MARPNPQPKTKDTEQGIVNLTVDKEFNVIMAEMIGFDGTNLTRVKVDPDGTLNIA